MGKALCQKEGDLITGIDLSYQTNAVLFHASKITKNYNTESKIS